MVNNYGNNNDYYFSRLSLLLLLSWVRIINNYSKHNEN